LAYRAQDSAQASPIILNLLENANGGLRFPVYPSWRPVVRAQEVEYVESLLRDFLERAEERAEAG
jgi:hypothetical protein